MERPEINAATIPTSAPNTEDWANLANANRAVEFSINKQSTPARRAHTSVEFPSWYAVPIPSFTTLVSDAS